MALTRSALSSISKSCVPSIMTLGAVAGPSRTRHFINPERPRHISTSTSLLARQNPAHASSLSTRDQQPRDAAIPFRTVSLVNPTTGKLEPPMSLQSALRSYDHSTHSLVLVSADANTPIVKLLNLEEERLKLREAEAKDKLRRKAAAEEKELQISWGSADGDIGHKIDIARAIVEKGDRVQLVFAPRSGGGQAAEVGRARKEELVALFEEKLGEVGTKWRDDEKTKTTLLTYWQAKEEVRVEKKQKLTEKEMDKRKEKDEKKEARRRKEEERRRKAGLEE